MCCTVQNIVQFRTLYSSEHRTENFIHVHENFENFITGEESAAVSSLLYSSAVGKTAIKTAHALVSNISISQRNQALFHEFGDVSAVCSST